MVGDRAETDGLFAHELGCLFALVLTGVTAPDAVPMHPVPDLVAPETWKATFEGNVEGEREHLVPQLTDVAAVDEARE